VHRGLERRREPHDALETYQHKRERRQGRTLHHVEHLARLVNAVVRVGAAPERARECFGLRAVKRLGSGRSVVTKPSTGIDRQRDKAEVIERREKETKKKKLRTTRNERSPDAGDGE
jgi:hypothetical protein